MALSPNAVILCNSSLVGSTAAATSGFNWQGGKSVLALSATAYGSVVYLQMLGPDGVTWISINASTYSANQVTAYDLPRGQYKIINGASSSVNIFATLASVPY